MFAVLYSWPALTQTFAGSAIGTSVVNRFGLAMTARVDEVCYRELTVTSGERHKGHGSRLQQAAVDTLAADRFTRAVTWVGAADDELRAFLTQAGWAADGAHRELDLYGDGAVTVKQVRLHVALP